MRKLLLFIAVSIFALTVSAHDFVAANSYGQVLYFEKLSDSEAAVTWRGRDFSDYHYSYTGQVIIPDKVIWDGQEYTVTEINHDAFAQQYELTSLVIPETVTHIGSDAFEDCPMLEAFYGPLATDDHRCVVRQDECIVGFAPCGITSYTLPRWVTGVYEGVFCGCKELKSITIPETAEIEFDKNVFECCSNLEAFYGKYASADHRCLIVENTLVSFASAGVSNYEIPSSVTEIGYAAFFGCEELKSITIPNTVSSIGNYAFEACRYLEHINLPNGLREIGDEAFGCCNGLEAIYIPETVNYIGELAFAWCQRVRSIYIFNSDPSKIELYPRSFDFFDFVTLYVPRGSKIKYMTTEPWSNAYRIEEFDPTGIASVISNKPTNETFYNLQGQKTVYTQKGIYIQRGKKMIK